MADPVFLSNHWREAWALLGAAAPEDGVRAALFARYSEPARVYHTLQHLAECFRLWDEARKLAHRPGEVLVALWFHDAVYDTRATDNERRSADWAAEVLREVGASPVQCERIRDLILATRHAAPPPPGDSALMGDIDLGILGAPLERFEEYEEQIRKEYDWVPEPLFRATRARILSDFLARPSIFSTAHFVERYEAAARANLTRSVARLTG